MFLVFAGEELHCRGGAYDLISTENVLEVAVQEALECLNKDEDTRLYDNNWNWAHIYDTEKKSIIWTNFEHYLYLKQLEVERGKEMLASNYLQRKLDKMKMIEK